MYAKALFRVLGLASMRPRPEPRNDLDAAIGNNTNMNVLQ